MKLSDTAVTALTSAAARNDRLVPRRPKSPPIADLNVCRALEKAGMLEAAPLPQDGDDSVVSARNAGDRICFRITGEGFSAINPSVPGTTLSVAVTGAHSPPPALAEAARDLTITGPREPISLPPFGSSDAFSKLTLRAAAQALLDALDSKGNLNAVSAAIAALRSALARPAARSSVSKRADAPRAGTKQETVLAMLRRTEGASGPQIAEATGWNDNTVRGFLAGLRKKGVDIVSAKHPNPTTAAGAGKPGSTTIYKLALSPGHG